MKPWEPHAVLLLEPQSVCNAIRECADEITRLRTENEALRRDAERYRSFEGSVQSDYEPECRETVFTFELRSKGKNKTFAQAIDAAMKE